MKPLSPRIPVPLWAISDRSSACRAVSPGMRGFSTSARKDVPQAPERSSLWCKSMTHENVDGVTVIGSLVGFESSMLNTFTHSPRSFRALSEAQQWGVGEDLR